jgi:hypothetical protein
MVAPPPNTSKSQLWSSNLPQFLHSTQAHCTSVAPLWETDPLWTCHLGTLKCRRWSEGRWKLMLEIFLHFKAISRAMYFIWQKNNAPIIQASILPLLHQTYVGGAFTMWGDFTLHFALIHFGTDAAALLSLCHSTCSTISYYVSRIQSNTKCVCLLAGSQRLLQTRLHS